MSTGLAKRKRSQSCFQLNALVVVEVNVVVDHFIGLIKSLRLVSVYALSFQDAEEIFSQCRDYPIICVNLLRGVE